MINLYSYDNLNLILCEFERLFYSFEKLGWFRKDALGHFTVRNGKVKIQRMHLAKVENCKDQKSQSFLDAHHYVDYNDPEVCNFLLPSFKLSHKLDDIEKETSI